MDILAGKVALVTGAASGIGRAIALKLGAEGCKVAVNDLPEKSDEADSVRQEIKRLGGEATVALANVGDIRQVKEAIDRVVQEWGQIDILVNNAGLARQALVLRISESQWDTVLDTNLKGAFLCTQYVLRSMLGLGWGRIINIASVAGINGNLGRSDYAASKGGLIAFTRSVAAEVGPRNITVNAVAPGLIMTPIAEQLSAEEKAAVMSRLTLKRFGRPEEVAELVGFLASDRAGYITGQVICIDGGVL